MIKPFKKLHTDIKEVLETLEIDTPTNFQSVIIPVIKSGSNIICTGKKGSGKTTTLILTTLQKLKCEAYGNAPRALVVVENRDCALALYDAFITYTRRTSLRVYACDEKLHVDVLKSEIFEGVDIIISTPNTMSKLLFAEGINTTQLKIFNIDDAAFLIPKTSDTALMSITQGINKCQFIIYLEQMDPKIKRFESIFMKHYKLISA